MQLIDLNTAANLDQSALAALTGGSCCYVSEKYIGSNHCDSGWQYRGMKKKFLGYICDPCKGYAKKYKVKQLYKRVQKRVDIFCSLEWC